MKIESILLLHNSLRHRTIARVVYSYSRSAYYKYHNNNINNSFLNKTFSSFSCAPNKKENMGMLRWYLRLLESRPIPTKSVTASLIYAAADVTSQAFYVILRGADHRFQKRKLGSDAFLQEMITMTPSGSFDTMRTLRMAGFGLLIVGPAQHTWFNFVARILPKRDTITTMKKLTMGQVCYGPCINSIFFSFNAALQGEDGNEIIARLKRDLIPTLISGLMFWPLCDFLTFKAIPVHLQPLVNSSFSYIWTIYLTYMANLQKAGID